MNTTTLVYVTTSFVGYHRWTEAPAEVTFLRYWHRHVFHVKLTVRVDHSDRDVEFFMLKRDVDAYLKTAFDGGRFAFSCEQIAEFIIAKMQSQRYEVHSCEVSEDGENGAVVIVNHT